MLTAQQSITTADTLEHLGRRMHEALARGHGDLLAEGFAVSGQRYLPDEGRGSEGRNDSFQNFPAPIMALGDLGCEPGFHARTLDGRSYLVARDGHGALRVFRNTCRHRGAELTCRAGAATANCPYHGWSYGLDGKLRAAYGSESGVDRNLGLVEVDSFCGAGFLWVGKPAHSLSDDLEKMVRLHGLGVPETVSEFVLSGAYHWKIGVEAFLETYHFAVAHKATLGQIPVKNVALFDGGDATLARLVVPWRLPVNGAEEDVRDFCHFMYFFFPNTFFLVFAEHFGWLTIEADGGARTKLIYRGMSRDRAPTEELKAKIRESVGFLKVVNAEDVALCESVQRGVRADSIFHLTRYEAGIAWFHARLRDLDS